MPKLESQFSKVFKQFEQQISPSSSKKELEQLIKKISKFHKVDKAKLTRFLKYQFFIKLYKQTDINSLVELNLNQIKKTDFNGFKLIESDLKKILKQSISLVIRFGFKKSFSEKGIRMANEGDSAQFLFVARAILAGFNCSNVDLRSSKYDAVIDYDSVLLRMQVKGTSLGSNISFMSRSRGGAGDRL